MNRSETLEKIRQQRNLIVRDTKPTLGAAGIAANIAHLEARIQTAYDNWQQELMELEYWIDQQQALEYQEVKDGF